MKKKNYIHNLFEELLNKLVIIIAASLVSLLVHIVDTVKESKDIKWIGEHLSDKQKQINELKENK